jgi:SHS family lactate transporter-like MFS transporter
MNTTTETVGVGTNIRVWQWRVFVANYLGLVFEAYDLTIYSLLVVPLSEYFHVPSWYSFLVLTLMYVCRGVGGLVFGHIADKLGRRNALVLTVLGYSLTTGLTGLSWSIASLLIFRALSGLFIGGEYVSYSYTMEVVPSRYRGHFSGAVISSYAVGFMLATGSYSLASVIAGSNFADGNGWRWLFFVGVLPALIALWLRIGVEESPIWRRLADSGSTRPAVPLFEIFKPKYLRRTLHCWFMMAALLWVYDVIALAQPTLLHYLHVSQSRIGILVLIANVGALLASLVGGWASQRVGRRKALIVVAIVSMPTAVVCAPFWMLPAIPTYLYLATFGFIGAFVTQSGFGVMPAFLSERYPTEVRATGSAGTYNLGQVIAGWSLTLLSVTSGSSASAFMVGIVVNAVIAAIVLLLLTLLATETKDVDLQTEAVEQKLT